MSLSTAFRPPTVGLDIGSSGVKAVALRAGRTGWSLVAAGEAPMPGASMWDERPADPSEVSGAIRQVLDGFRMRRARIVAALSGHAVIVKRLSLPVMTPGELAEAIPWEAEQYVPFDLADVRLDYQVVGTGMDEAKSSLDVLLVAAKKEQIDERTNVILDAGRQADILDVEAFALANAYQLNYPDRRDPLTATIHIGRRATIVCFLEHGQLAFTRDIAVGGYLYSETLRRELGVDGPTSEAIQRGRVPREVSREHAAELIRHTSAQLVLEVRKTVDFYRATAPVEQLTRVVVSGGAWETAGLVDLLGEELGAPVEVFDPFRRVARPKGAVGVEAVSPAFAVAVGLALRKAGDR